MHIPACETSQLELVRFAPALEAASRPSPDYDVNKWLYVPNVYSEYRYILGTRGQKPLICIGINPSTAAPDALDNTLKSVERVSHFNGYDSFIMFNVYAQRATDPTGPERPQCGRPGGPSLRSGTICPPAFGTWSASGPPGTQCGTPQGSAPKRATLTTPCTCARTAYWSPLT